MQNESDDEKECQKDEKLQLKAIRSHAWIIFSEISMKNYFLLFQI